MSAKVCIVTGIGHGLGSAYARRFAAEGYRVALLGRTLEKLNGFAESIEGSFQWFVTYAMPMLSKPPLSAYARKSENLLW